MSKNHDENKDITLLKRVCYVNVGSKTIQAPKSSIIGIRTWGRIDYLCNYKGYHFIWDNGTVVDKSDYDNSDKKKEFRKNKKAAKEHMLTDKTKRTSNRK